MHVLYLELGHCRDPSALAYAIKRSCENKAEVVSLDEKEGGVRATLNLGHTFGHVSFIFALKYLTFQLAQSACCFLLAFCLG